MMTIKTLMLNDFVYNVFKFEFHEMKVILVTNEIGLLCTSLHLDSFEHPDFIACRINNAQTIDELLVAPLVEISAGAEKIGLTIGMTGKEALLTMT